MTDIDVQSWNLQTELFLRDLGLLHGFGFFIPLLLDLLYVLVQVALHGLLRFDPLPIELALAKLLVFAELAEELQLQALLVLLAGIHALLLLLLERLLCEPHVVDFFAHAHRFFDVEKVASQMELWTFLVL